MKAYEAYDEHHPEGYKDIVFAETAAEAKKKAFSTGSSCQEAEWIDLRVRRLPYLDDMESCSEKKIRYITLINGWWYNDGDAVYTEDNIDEAIANGVVEKVEDGSNE